MSNNISLEKAIVMTSRYRAERNNILKPEYQKDNLLLTCETFERSAFDFLLAQPRLDKVRIYFGMNEKLQVKAIIVGVNSSDADILPSKSLSLDDNDQIVEEGLPCPTACPPPSPLNED